MTLTEFAYGFKKTLKGGILLYLLFLLTRSGVRAAIGYYREKNPPPTPGPKMALGVLEPPKLIRLSLPESASPTYRLETKTGRLPSFPDRIEVYPVVLPEATLMSEARIRDLAEMLGFRALPKNLSTTQLIWTDPTYQRVLKADSVLRTLSLETGNEVLANNLTVGSVPQGEAAIKIVRDFLAAKGLGDPFLAEADAEAVPVSFTAGGMRGVDSNEATATYVAFRKKIGDSPIYSLWPDHSLVGAAVTGSKIEAWLYPRIDYTLWNVAADQSSTYPLLPIGRVWEEIQAGRGFLVELRPLWHGRFTPYSPIEVTEIQIKDIQFGYFESTALPEFLQPIYVFSGLALMPDEATASVVIYYPAVDYEALNPPAE